MGVRARITQKGSEVNDRNTVGSTKGGHRRKSTSIPGLNLRVRARSCDTYVRGMLPPLRC